MAASASSIVAGALALVIAAPPAPTIDRRPSAPDEPLAPEASERASASSSASSSASATATTDASASADAPAGAAADAPAAEVDTAAPALGPAPEPVPIVGEARPVYVGCGSMLPACERLTIVGTVAGGLGLAAVLGAGGLLLAPDRVIADEPSMIRTHTQAGTTLLAIGVGLVTTSLLMILTATRATNRERRRRAIARLGGAR